MKDTEINTLEAAHYWDMDEHVFGPVGVSALFVVGLLLSEAVLCLFVVFRMSFQQEMLTGLWPLCAHSSSSLQVNLNSMCI